MDRFFISVDMFMGPLCGMLVLIFMGSAYAAPIEEEKAFDASPLLTTYTAAGRDDAISPEEGFDSSTLRALRDRPMVFREKGFDATWQSEPGYVAGSPGLKRGFAAPEEMVLSGFGMDVRVEYSPREKGFDSSSITFPTEPGGGDGGYFLSRQEPKRVAYSEEERLKELERVFETRVPETVRPGAERPTLTSVETAPRRREPVSPYVPASVEGPATGDGTMRHFNLGVFYHKRGDTVRAIEEYEKVLALDPSNAEAHNNLGVIYKEIGNLDKAAEHYLFVTTLDPGMEEAHNNLGVIHYLQGNAEAAEVEYKRALEVNPDNLTSLVNLGIVYKAQGQTRRAINAFEHVLEADPYNAEAQYNLAVFYEELGHLEAAIWYYNRFIENAGNSRRELANRVAGHVEDLKMASGEIIVE
ncbi:MAG: tetratricopeptide repeat protein [Candidatus Brocadiales bacterium]